MGHNGIFPVHLEGGGGGGGGGECMCTRVSVRVRKDVYDKQIEGCNIRCICSPGRDVLSHKSSEIS